jgi:predicted O-linked N-acetylglucosamine transferase (SPINDLY family)/predicted SAM-dependent methyltransferase
MTLNFRGLFKPKANDHPGSAQTVDDLKASAAIALAGGDLEGAVQLFDELIRRKSDHAEAYYKRANALNGLGRCEAALADYDQAITRNPEYANAYCNRGTVLERLNRWDEALASYNRAVALNPGDFLVYYNRGSVLKRLERIDEALASYERAIALKSDYVEAYLNRGNVLQELQRHEAAVASYDMAIQLKPIFAEAFQARGSSLFALRRFEAAVASYNQAIALNPNYKFILGMRRYAKMQICDWDDLAPDLQRITQGLREYSPVCSPFPVLALVDSATLQRLAAEIWVREQCPYNPALGAIPARPRSDKIRIGYFSADFRSHPVSALTAELFETHDRSRFEITAFAFGPEAGDAMRSRLERAFDRFVDVRDQTDIEVALLARKLGVDIAVDLGGFTEHSRTKIFALRAAPIQLSYIGYLGTMGAPYMDYLVADTTIIPAGEQQEYSEKIIYLPSYQVNDSQRHIAERTFTRENLGLPPVGFVFSCFNANYKITPSTFEVWMRILTRVEASSLFLYTDNQVSARNLLKEAQRCGVDPHRIVFGGRLDQADYLARFRTMDLFLDTLPYNAGTTASDALWAGLPVLTCAGRTFAGRIAASLLQAIELPELITATPAQYEDLAVQLATNPQRLAQIRRQLASNRLKTPLFDTVLYAKNLEYAYAQMYERSHAGLPPEHIYPESQALAQRSTPRNSEPLNVPRRLHIGGQVRTPGWEVLDANPGPCVDHVANASDLRGFEDNSFEKIYASHVVEHFDYRDQLVEALKEWYRVLTPAGTLYVSVPDLDVLARLFVDRTLLSAEDRFLVMRMIFGGHVDEHDYHLVGLNEEFLRGYLHAVGFTDIRRVSGFGLFQDTSCLELKNIPISLNMIAVKA